MSSPLQRIHFSWHHLVDIQIPHQPIQRRSEGNTQKLTSAPCLEEVNSSQIPGWQNVPSDDKLSTLMRQNSTTNFLASFTLLCSATANSSTPSAPPPPRLSMRLDYQWRESGTSFVLHHRTTTTSPSIPLIPCDDTSSREPSISAAQESSSASSSPRMDVAGEERSIIN